MTFIALYDVMTGVAFLCELCRFCKAYPLSANGEVTI